jgi:glutamate synthase domain-containing protein 2
MLEVIIASVVIVAVISVVGFLLGVVYYDVFVQKNHAILHNFPVVGHLRYILERVGPELRQYIVTNNDEERPFSRDQRRWVYASSKEENNLFDNYVIIKQSTFPWRGEDFPGELHPVPCARILGAHRGRKHAFRPPNIMSVSAMSYGSLSSAAVHAINKGCGMAGVLHNTGEGGICEHHDHGGGVIWQLGTGYFGARDPDGRFSLELLKERVERFDVKAIEIKLSQGAKPGKGGVLPAAKVTAEIARIRNVPIGQTVISPPYHSAFGSADEMLDFVEMIADETGLPVGIKSAVGDTGFFVELAELMARGDRGVDYMQIDGGEGGTGAAPLVFSDHVALPFLVGFTRVYRIFAERGVHRDLLWVGSGKLGFPERALLAMTLGCDWVAVAREAMLAIGCIQAQKCHTGHCPAGVATQEPWLMKGLDPTHKANRFANYAIAMRKELLALAHACGQAHPALVGLDKIEILDSGFSTRSAAEVFGYQDGWGSLRASDRAELLAMLGAAPQTEAHGKRAAG